MASLLSPMKRKYKLGKKQICFSLKIPVSTWQSLGKSGIKKSGSKLKGEKIPLFKKYPKYKIIWKYLNKKCVEFV